MKNVWKTHPQKHVFQATQTQQDWRSFLKLVLLEFVTVLNFANAQDNASRLWVHRSTKCAKCKATSAKKTSSSRLMPAAFQYLWSLRSTLGKQNGIKQQKVHKSGASDSQKLYQTVWNHQVPKKRRRYEYWLTLTLCKHLGQILPWKPPLLTKHRVIWPEKGW